MDGRTRRRILAAAACSALIAAATAGSIAWVPRAFGSHGLATARVTVTLVDFRIRLSRASVPAGPVVFEVTNKGAVAHDLVVAGHGRTRILRPGRKATLRVTFARSGSFRLSCSVPGHLALGMKTALQVGKRAPESQKHPAEPVPPAVSATLQLTPVAAGLGSITDVVSPPGDPDRVMVVQQNGLVSLLRDGVLQPSPFLDLRDPVHDEGEMGLLSLAFAPDYAASGLVYVDYNDRNGNVRVVEFRRSAASADAGDPSTARQVLLIQKPTADHNGGMMQFGPDGDLYVAVGDGGANPPTIAIGAYGQTLDDLLGSILRIDPRHGDPYAIPPGNPFAATPGARPEIVAYGLRNPWRFWIDAAGGEMLIGDVGEDRREEIDRLPLDHLGLDFGWPCTEGTVADPVTPVPSTCATAPLTPPLYHYPHSATRCSIIGGVVVRDPRLPALNGVYLWSDLCETQIYAVNPAAAEVVASSLGIGAARPATFGVDGLGRVYLGTADGSLYRLDPRS